MMTKSAMNIERQYEREERDIDERLNRGEISNDEYWKELRDLQRDYRSAAEEAAQDAYDLELSRW